MIKSIEVIRSEHRALAAVLIGLQALVDGIAEGRYALDVALIEAMIEYITEVPDRVHHPKEDDYLFVALRKRSPKAPAILDYLEAEHRDVRLKWTALAQALAKLKRDGLPGLSAFRAATDDYVDFQWHHMSTEEREVLPLARETLLPEDWAVIDAAFEGNESPWEGPAGKYKELFARIVSLAPAPIGLKDAAAPR